MKIKIEINFLSFSGIGTRRVNLYFFFQIDCSLFNQFHKMVKHTQTIRWQFANELFECVWPFCGIGASRVKWDKSKQWPLVKCFSEKWRFELILIESWSTFLCQDQLAASFILSHFIQSIVVFHIETSHLICMANQMVGFYMKCSTRLK